MRTRRCFEKRGTDSPKYVRNFNEFVEDKKARKKAKDNIDSRMKEKLADSILMGFFKGVVYKGQITKFTLDQVKDIIDNSENDLRRLVMKLEDSSGIEMLFGSSERVREKAPISRKAMDGFVSYFMDYVRRYGEKIEAKYSEIDPELKEIM